MPDYLPHTEDELAQMLGFLGLSSLDELFVPYGAGVIRVDGQVTLLRCMPPDPGRAGKS